MNLATALAQGTRLLEDASIAAPRLTAEVLLLHALRQPGRAFLYAHGLDELTETQWIHFGRYLHERLGGKPTQYITGRQEFYGREFRVTGDVLIPRPETEHVVEMALQAGRGARRILDVGTGSGAIAITLALETNAAVWGCDVSEKALAVARDNARSLGAGAGFVAGDLTAAFAGEAFDLIVSNPPYVALADREGLQREVRDHEPHVALFAGVSGLEIYERMIADAGRVLRPGGWLVLELGYRSLDPVKALLRWPEVREQSDLAGIPRVIAARAPGRA